MAALGTNGVIVWIIDRIQLFKSCKFYEKNLSSSIADIDLKL